MTRIFWALPSKRLQTKLKLRKFLNHKKTGIYTEKKEALCGPQDGRMENISANVIDAWILSMKLKMAEKSNITTIDTIVNGNFTYIKLRMIVTK